MLDVATKSIDYFIRLTKMKDQNEMHSSTRIYGVGKRKPTEDDSNLDDIVNNDELDVTMMLVT